MKRTDATCKVCYDAKQFHACCFHSTLGTNDITGLTKVIGESWPVTRQIKRETLCPILRNTVCTNPFCFNGKDGEIRFPHLGHSISHCPCEWPKEWEKGSTKEFMRFTGYTKQQWTDGTADLEVFQPNVVKAQDEQIMKLVHEIELLKDILREHDKGAATGQSLEGLTVAEVPFYYTPGNNTNDVGTSSLSQDKAAAHCVSAALSLANVGFNVIANIAEWTCSTSHVSFVVRLWRWKGQLLLESTRRSGDALAFILLHKAIVAHVVTGAPQTVHTSPSSIPGKCSSHLVAAHAHEYHRENGHRGPYDLSYDPVVSIPKGSWFDMMEEEERDLVGGFAN